MIDRLNIPRKRINWFNSIFLSTICIIALVATPIFLWNYDLGWQLWSLFAFYCIATGMSITLGYHRLFSHLSFKAKWPVKLFTLIFGACAFENSALNWCSDHRRHHKHVDHEEDPYDISKGFLWAHIGWIFFKLNPEPPMDNVADLRKDKLVMWQHRHAVSIAIIIGLVVPALIGYAIGGGVAALGAFIVVGIFRVFCVQQSTFFINSLCHMTGTQPYSTKCSARDSPVMALFTFGEGYHNYHHEFQHDYRNGVKAFTYDPTKWAIWGLSKLGLVSNLRRVPAAKILLAEMAEARRKADTKIEKMSLNGKPICDRMIESANEIREKMAANYSELEKAMSEKVELSRQAMKDLRKDTRAMVRSLSALRPQST